MNDKTGYVTILVFPFRVGRESREHFQIEQRDGGFVLVPAID